VRTPVSDGEKTPLPTNSENMRITINIALQQVTTNYSTPEGIKPQPGVQLPRPGPLGRRAYWLTDEFKAQLAIEFRSYARAVQ
jgi:hypothetical protein